MVDRVAEERRGLASSHDGVSTASRRKLRTATAAAAASRQLLQAPTLSRADVKAIMCAPSVCFDML